MYAPIWVFAIEEDNLQENTLNLIFPKGVSILLVKKEGQLYAISNKCAHMACPLVVGTLEGYTIKCASNDLRFECKPLHQSYI